MYLSTENREVLKALADGKTIQVKSVNATLWSDVICPVFDFKNYIYRVKPKPRVFWVNIYELGNTIFSSKELADRAASGDRIDCIKVIEEI